MSAETRSIPVVLAVGGHDPGGGAGIQADIEAIGANGAHPATVVTCLTVQDSCNLSALHPVEPTVILSQAMAVLADTPVSAIKIGLLGSPGAARAVAELLQSRPGVPVVLDPVLAAGGGHDLAGDELLQAIRQRLLPHCTLLTPNTPEAHRLSGRSPEESLESCAKALLAQGAGAVLLTGTHEREQEPEIVHRLYRPSHPAAASTCKRLPGRYHGSGCTLAAAIAARLAHGETLEEAVGQALGYTWKSLTHAFRAGRCQSLPDRLFRQARLRARPIPNV